MGRPAGRPHRLHLRDHRRGVRAVRHASSCSALFVTLAYAGIRIASRTKDPFVKYASAGIVVWLLGQALINIGMVLGLLPVIGIPLPLISYGGSALLPTLDLARPAALVRAHRARRGGGAACQAPRAPTSGRGLRGR